MMDPETFFKLHDDLPREGPGSQEDVDWAVGQVNLRPDAVICDAGSGPGGDIAALLAHVPAGRVVAVDSHTPFAETAAQRFADEGRVHALAADMAKLDQLPEAPFDLIWCAGALYFLGVQPGLERFRTALKPRGVVAFSAPCWFTPKPSDAAIAFWQGFDGVQTPAEIRADARATGFNILAERPVGDDAWEAYYRPMEAKIATLRAGADAALSQTLDENAQEAATWRQVCRETGYQLIVAQLS